jgi:hypothetical protein
MVQKMDMERFSLKQLNEEEVKEQYQAKIKKQVCSSGKLTMIMGTSIRHGTLSGRPQNYRPKRTSIFVNQSLINHGLIRNV